MEIPVGRSVEKSLVMLDSMSGSETSMEGVSRVEMGWPSWGEYVVAIFDQGGGVGG